MSIEDDLQEIQDRLDAMRSEAQQLKLDAKNQVERAHELGDDLQALQQELKDACKNIDDSEIIRINDLIKSIKDSLKKYSKKETVVG